MQSLKSSGLRRCQSRSRKQINWIKLSSRRTDQTAENNLQEMAACLFSRKRRSKGHEQELREELLQSPQVGIGNYPSRKVFATHLSDSHSSTFSDLTAGFSRKYATLSHARFKEKGRDKKNKKAVFTVARVKFLLSFQTQKTTQKRIIVESFFYQLGSKYDNLHSCMTRSTQ